MVVNDNPYRLNEGVALETIASKLAPTKAALWERACSRWTTTMMRIV
ncbi:hypothetical protein J2W17_003576 [Pseudomonas lini]|nr:hypothetical protein [Pseudomonas lini]